ncbi:chaperone modulator CbpM [Polaromonas sp.]|uniref:chaperone modulator CbpM n=1 Tax=Polaromonas sp. TaxID=1869339 RepID=UPI00356679A8
MTPDPTRIRLTGFVLEEQTGLTLVEVCRACAAEPDMVMALVEEGLVAPSGAAPAEWRFTGVHMHRARVAVRLQKDLGVNIAGAALALQLLEELDSLRARLQSLEDTGH